MNINTNYGQRVVLNYHDLLWISFLNEGAERRVLELVGDEMMHALAQKRNS